MTAATPPIIRALRPTQWVKNALVVAAPAAAGALGEGSVALDTLLAFIAFSMAASATYLANDAADVEADRQHPKKRFRPIAAGELSVATARIAAIALAVTAVLVAAAVRPLFGLVVIAYLVMTTAYSMRLKHVVIVDVVLVSLGFLLRAIGGGVATDVPLTKWFYLVVSCCALLLIVGKRLGEFQSTHGSKATRRVLDSYSRPMLRVLLGIAAFGAIVGYVAWAIVESADLGGRRWLALASIAPFIGGIIRYGWLSEQGRGESPDRLVFRDPPTVTFGVIWAILYGAAIYGG